MNSRKHTTRHPDTVTQTSARRPTADLQRRRFLPTGTLALF